MPTVTKNKATETRPKGAKNTATVSKTTKATKPEVKKPVAPVKNTTKTEAKTPGKNKASTKATKKSTEYSPNNNSMRYFIMLSLRRGGSAKKIKARAAQLAEKAGVEKFASVEAYKGFDVAYFVNMLKEKGMSIEEDGNKYKLAA
jgi:hypothetical protein